MSKILTLDDVGHRIASTPMPNGAKVVGLVWDIEWKDLVSNSHSAPKGYPRNWHVDDDKPRGYPGWQGGVWIRFDKDPEFMRLNQNLSVQGLHLGTGGGGSYSGIWTDLTSVAYRSDKGQIHCFSWDCKIFDFDFPEEVAGTRADYDRKRAAAHEQYKLDVIAARAAHEKKMAWDILNGKRAWYYSEPGFVFRALHHKFKWEDPEQVAADAKFMAKYDKVLHENKK